MGRHGNPKTNKKRSCFFSRHNRNIGFPFKEPKCVNVRFLAEKGERMVLYTTIFRFETISYSEPTATVPILSS